MNCQDITKILFKVVLNTIKKNSIQNTFTNYTKFIYTIFVCHVRICIMIIGVPNFLYCCIILIMVLCHGRSPIQKTKNKNNKKYQNRLQKTENKFKKRREII